MHRFNLPQELVDRLKKLDITTPTRIQELTIPDILNGNDILAKAPTSAGKTLAFVLPIIAKCDTSKPDIQKLILTPTRELASQILGVIKSISPVHTATLYGGVPLAKHIDVLKTNPQIIIATPGRLIDIINKGVLNVSKVDTFVLDEADRMLDMGFFDDIIYISSKLPTIRQTLLFSATYPDKIKLLSQKILKSAKEIDIDIRRYQIQELGYEVTSRYDGLKDTLLSHHSTQSIIFCNTKDRVFELSSNLSDDGFDVVEFHGGLDQHKRDEAPQQVFLLPNKPLKIKSDIEKFIGENLINKIGIAITVIGVAIGAKYSIEHELISPLTRMILGYLIGIGLLGFGIKLKKKYESYSTVLVSGAIAIMYFITYFAYSFYFLYAHFESYHKPLLKPLL